MGRKTAITYLSTVIISAILSGLALNWIFDFFNFQLSSIVSHAHEHHSGGWVSHAWSISLIVLLIVSYSGKYLKRKPETSTLTPLSFTKEINMSEIFNFNVQGMNCSHCSDSVKRGLENVNSVESADVDLTSGNVIVKGNVGNKEELYTVIQNLGFSVKV